MGSLEMLRAHNTMRDIGDQKNKETSEQELKPLRYNPGLKCDPELEAMRPERQSKHTPMPTGDWKKYLIKTQPSYEGSFADADIQKFRPNPTPSAMEDPWFVSQLPGQAMCVAPGPYSSYVAPYPCDQLQQIKMRNRRFQQSCALDNSGGHRAQPGQTALAEDMMMMTNMAYSDLQRQVQMFQTMPAAPLPPTRSCMDEEFLTVDMLPTPRKIIPKPPADTVEPPKCLSSSRQVEIGDQIAIRSYVLGKTL